MKTWIALFRGINVGGRNVVKMADLKQDLAALKLTGVRTYIQSGNVVFESAKRSARALEKQIAECVQVNHGFTPEVLLLGRDEFACAIDANPFPDATKEPKTLHYYFLAKSPRSFNEHELAQCCAESERYRWVDRVFYLHAPNGIGRSKLAANVEKILAVPATARNYRTVEKLWQMVNESA